MVLEITLFLSFLPPFARAIRKLIAEAQIIGAMKTTAKLATYAWSIATSKTSSEFANEIRETCKDAVYAGLTAGFLTGCLAIVILAISWAPWWIRFILFLIGLLINALPFLAVMIEERRNKRSGVAAVARSAGAEVGAFIVIFTIGTFIWALLFGGIVEKYVDFIERLVRFLFH